MTTPGHAPHLMDLAKQNISNSSSNSGGSLVKCFLRLSSLAPMHVCAQVHTCMLVYVFVYVCLYVCLYVCTRSFMCVLFNSCQAVSE